MMARLMIVMTLFAAIGCVRQSTEPSRDDAVAMAAPSAVSITEATDPAIDSLPVAAVPSIQPVAKKSAEPPPTFNYPPDLAGQALPRVVSPVAPPQPDVAKLGQLPIDRTPPSTLLHPDPVSSKLYSPSPVLLARPVGAQPTAPPEKVPLDVGNRAEAVPAKPVLPEAPLVARPGPDVNEPPNLPPLGRAQPDRAPFDDPTADLGNAAIAGQSKTPLLAPSPFLKFGLPDPFEFSNHVKPRVLPMAEPNPLPVLIDPERRK